MHADAFEVLGVPARFDLSAPEIDAAYLSRAAEVHPDVAEGDEAAIRSAALNQAKRVLDDPERRANALLARLGGPAKEQDKSLPAGFLMDIMETREAVEDARRTGDPAAVARWMQWAQHERGRYIEKIAPMFREAGEIPTPERLRSIRAILNAWRYVERLIEQLDPDYDPARADFQG